jgi:hypothetical protein
MVLDASTHTYYAGTDRTGVWKSTDGGASFVQTALTGAEAGNVQVFSLALASATRTLYAGAATGLFASTDSGGHFTQLTGIPTGLEVDFVAADDNSPANVFVGSNKGWFNSADGGAHFTRATGLPMDTAVLLAGVIDEPDSIAFAATDKGIFKSNDLGASFTPTNLNFSACYGLAIDKVSMPHIVYATCDAGIISSTDGFNTNFTFGTGFSGSPFGVLVDTSASGAPKPVLIGVQNIFFSQVYESFDGGATFTPSSLGLLADESIPVLLDPTTTPETIFVHDSWEHDATITEFNQAGSKILFSTGLGGSNDESGTGIALDDEGDVYVTGITLSTDFPITPGAFQTKIGERESLGEPVALINGFVSKLTFANDD